MTALYDILSPDYVGEDRITVSVDEASRPLMAYKPVTLNLDYADTGDEGAVVPIELIVQPKSGAGGTEGGYVNKVFRSTPPTTFTFAPQGAGDYLIVIREVAHNRWQGRLIITVGGDKFSTLD